MRPLTKRKARKRERVLRDQMFELDEKASAALERSKEINELAREMADYRTIYDERGEVLPIVPKKGEEVLAVGRHGFTLFEMRTRTGTYKGSSHGLSIRSAEGVYYRPSVHSGSIKETTEEWRAVDRGGTFVITDRRAVYAGTRYAREFPWSKLASYTIARLGSLYLVVLPVSTRVISSAIGFPSNPRFKELMVSIIQCGISIDQGDHEGFVRQLQQDAEEIRRVGKESQAAADELRIQMETVC